MKSIVFETDEARCKDDSVARQKPEDAPAFVLAVLNCMEDARDGEENSKYARRSFDRISKISAPGVVHCCRSEA